MTFKFKDENKSKGFMEKLSLMQNYRMNKKMLETFLNI